MKPVNLDDLETPNEYPQRLKAEIGELLGGLIDSEKTYFQSWGFDSIDVFSNGSACGCCYAAIGLDAAKLERLAEWALESKRWMERQ